MGVKVKRLCTICARGGSKGVAGKNIRELLGKPLIAYSLEQAKNSGLFDLLAVSSDADEILELARFFGADYLIKRPAELATDLAAKLPAIRHCVTEVEMESGIKFDTLVDLDATSPLRFVEDIVGAVGLLESNLVSNVITGTPARRSPYFNLIELSAQGVAVLSKSPRVKVLRRQDAPPCYDMNASIYVWQHDALFRNDAVFSHDTRLFVMPENRSVDIDSELDFRFVEMIMRERSVSMPGSL